MMVMIDLQIKIGIWSSAYETIPGVQTNTTYLHPLVYILNIRKQNENREAQGRCQQKWKHIWKNIKYHF